MGNKEIKVDGSFLDGDFCGFDDNNLHSNNVARNRQKRA